MKKLKDGYGFDDFKYVSFYDTSRDKYDIGKFYLVYLIFKYGMK